MKRKLTDLIDEKPVKNISLNKKFEFGITVGSKSKPKQVIISATSLTFLGSKIKQYLTDILKGELNKTFNLSSYQKILVVGLGNCEIFNDSLGPKIVEKLIISRGLNLKPEVSAFCPNVYSNTGIETSELVKAVCQLVKPELVIILDALATVSASRLCSCFQIFEGGITAGSGANSKNKKITKQFLGVKNVVSIGVPMLIYGQTIAPQIQNKTLKNSFQNYPSLILSPANINKITNLLCEIVSLAINETLFQNLSKEEIEILTN